MGYKTELQNNNTELQSNNVDLQSILSAINELPESLNTSDATAQASEILSGETAYVNGAKVTGTMANNGAVSATLECGATYTIPKGYHNGNGIVINTHSMSSKVSGEVKSTTATELTFTRAIGKKNILVYNLIQNQADNYALLAFVSNELNFNYIRSYKKLEIDCVGVEWNESTGLFKMGSYFMGNSYSNSMYFIAW